MLRRARRRMRARRVGETSWQRQPRSRVPVPGFGLKAPRPALIESLRVEERLFAGTFAPWGVPRLYLFGYGSDTARPGDPLRCGRESGHAELPLRQPESRRERRLQRRGDRPQHARRIAAVEGQDRALRVEREAAGARLGRAERSDCRLRRRLDCTGRRLPGDGASDQHRLLDSDRLGRSEHRLRSPAQAHQPRGGNAESARAKPRTQCRLGRPRGARGHERHGDGSVEDERHRRDRADTAVTARAGGRREDEAPRLHAPRGGRADS